MLTLADINALPNDPSEEHLRSLGLLPQPPPTPSIVPHLGAGEKIPVPSAVTGSAPTAPSDWRAKLAATVPRAASTTSIPALSPVTAPDLGTGAQPEMPASAESATPGVNFPKLAPLNFKERQALPLTSEGNSDYASSKLARLRDQDANPYGSAENHPGILGKIGHYAAKIGNIAGDIIAPATMANIPGTDLNRQVQEHGLEHQIASASKAEEEAKNSESERELRAAETKKLAAQGSPDILQDSAGNAVGWRDEKGAVHSLDEEGTPAAIKEIADKWEGKSQGKPESIDQAAVQAKMKEVNPQTGKPYTAYEARVELANDVAGGKSKGPTSAEEDQRYEKILTDVRMGKEVSPEDKTWAGVYEKRKTLGPFAAAVAQAPQKSTERSDKSYQYNATQLDKLGTPIEQAQARVGRLQEALKQNTPIADALIAPELLSIMAGGAGSGLRMTDAEINRIVGGQGHWDALRKQAQLWALDPSKANSITPEQRKEIRSLTAAVQQKLNAKQVALDRAHQELLNSDDPKEHRKAVTDAHRELEKIDTGAAAPEAPAGKTTVYDPQGTPHFVNVDKLEKFLKDPKYKGWSQNAPR
jgi:hypothetical protein